MATHDPYWRLFESHSLPAPAYESPEQIRAALATAAVVASVPDSVAVRPDPASRSADDPQRDEAVHGVPALLPRPAEPMIAVPVALAPQAPAETAPDAPVAGSQPAESAPVLALVPPRLRTPDLPAAAEPGPAPVLASLAPPAPVGPPEAPAPLWIAADSGSEEALTLARAERAEIQRRLALAGFDPKGFDGVFGPRTRHAIADFQEAWGFPSTGYLDAAAYADLRARTEEAYVALASRAADEPRAAPKIAPVARERQHAVNDSDGCARDGGGRILERQSLACDLKGFAEKVVSLGHDKLPHE